MRISGVLIGLMVAMVLLGPGPGSTPQREHDGDFVDRTRTPFHYLRNNIVVFLWFPLAASLFFQATVHLPGLSPHDVAYYLVVFLAFVVALVVNFIGVFAYMCHLDGSAQWLRKHERLHCQ